jgi:tetratricopeptide (TPR) repeat protein
MKRNRHSNRLMKTIFLAISVVIFSLPGISQENASQTAKNYIRQGDYNNAILVLNRAIETDRQNIELKKDLAFAYYLQRDYTKAIETIRPVIDNKDGDEQAYQITGMIYRAIEDTKEAERIYKSGLRRFPESGVLSNEYGELLWSNSDFSAAAKQWQKGIQNDPGFPGNYYNAAKYYFLSADKVWGIIYGEIFVNLESYSKRTPEIKTMLLEGYKKLFAETEMTKSQDMKNEFVKAFLDVMKNESQMISSGITPDGLSALRTRFILTWYEKYATKFPFRLFDYQRQLAKAGLFDAYNQWIFGAANNLSAFQQWTATHPDEYNRFINFQKNRVYKQPEGQYYNNKP